MRMTMRFPKGLSKALTLSYDDGVFQDEKLISILNKYNIKATFNLNSGLFGEGRRLTKKSILELYGDSGHEVASHTLTHPFLEQLPKGNALSEIYEDRLNLENLFHSFVKGFAYPYGTFNEDVIDCLRLSGILYARTTKSTEWFKMPLNWLTLNPTCHHNNDKLFDLLDEFLNFNCAEIHNDPKMFYLWGHSYEFDDNNNWERIEKFAKKATGKDDIWYATNLEICNYTMAYNQLYTNAKGDMIYNPTSTDLWVNIDGETRKIEKGKILNI